MKLEQLENQVIKVLEDLKAQDILVIDLESISSIADLMIICSSTSERHAKAIAQALITAMKQSKSFNSVEGLEEGDWILVDAGDIIIHIMQSEAREYYQLEDLWHTAPQRTIVPDENIHSSSWQ